MFLAAMAVIGWTFEYFRGEHAVGYPPSSLVESTRRVF
jgi:hypothetical protein